MIKFRRITIPGREPQYVRDDERGRSLADSYVWEALANGAEKAESVPVDRIPQRARRLDAQNRTGTPGYR